MLGKDPPRSPRGAHDASDLARVRVERSGDGPPVVERYSLDDKGIVGIVIQDTESGFERTYRLART